MGTAVLPTLYQYYTEPTIRTGLSDSQPYFTLNDKNVTLYSGAMHYFRVPPDYWRDRLRKMRAAGLNTVETYVPWNLHERQPEMYDFGQGGSDMEEFLDLAKFLRTAKEEDLLVIVRPGPYICSEWEFGGLPSWLLREKGMKVRTSEQGFMRAVRRYFDVLLPILALLQFTSGGPIVAFQIENEYGSTEQKGQFVPDLAYIRELREMFLKHGIRELLFTSDSPTLHGSVGTLPGVLLQTANFASDPEKEFDRLKELQVNKPTMAMEFWSGWFDHWSEVHNTRSNSDFQNVLERILRYPASVNMYMFHGGTNWGFMNGANVRGTATDNGGYQPDTTSYDYDAPLTEAGDYTEKYIMVRNLLKKYDKTPTRTPAVPSEKLRVAYPSVKINQQLKLKEILEKIPYRFASEKLVSMELLPMNNGSGQSYGYIVYRKLGVDIPKDSKLKIGGHVCDTVTVLINGLLISKPLTHREDLNGFGYWRIKDGVLNLGDEDVANATLELVVENWGRNNFGYLQQFNQFKGIWQGGVYLNNRELLGWEIMPMEFKKSWTNGLSGWHRPENLWLPGAALYKGSITINNPKDTYIDMSEWMKGIVIVNGFVLGRHASTLGPQQTLYWPAPLMKQGLNEIVIFEHFIGRDSIKFSENPIFYTPLRNRPLVINS